MTVSSAGRAPTPAERDAKQDRESEDGQVSSGGSSFAEAAAAGGGADAVPDTPDGVPENNIGDAEQGDFQRRGRDVQEDQTTNSTEAEGSEVDPNR